MKSIYWRLGTLLLPTLVFSIAVPWRAGAQDPPAPEQGKVTLKNLFAVGDVRTVDHVSASNFESTLESEGQQVPLNYSTRGRRAFKEEILAVKNGVPLARRLTFTAARTTTVKPDGTQTTRAASYQGKVVTVRRAGSKVTVTAAKGKLTAEDIKILQDMYRPEKDVEFYPKQSLAPGDEWTINSKILKRIFSDFNSGEMKGHFEAVEDRNGRSLARLRFDIRISGKPRGMPVPMTAEGMLIGYYDLGIDRESSSEMTLPVTVEGDFIQQGRRIHATGTGTIKVNETVRWIKVGGKPVTAPKPVPAA